MLLHIVHRILYTHEVCIWYYIIRVLLKADAIQAVSLRIPYLIIYEVDIWNLRRFYENFDE